MGRIVEFQDRRSLEQLVERLERSLALATQALAFRDKQLADVVRHLPVPVAMLDRALRYIAVSDPWLLEHARAPEQVIGRTHPELFPNDAALLSMLQSALDGRPSSADDDFVNPSGNDGAWLRRTVAPWRGVDGVVGGIMVTFENVSKEVEWRRAEQRARNSALAAMANAVAHEINTPLQVALLEAEELEHTLSQRETNPEELDAVRAINDTTRRIADIVRAMCIVSGGSVEVARAIPVAELLRELQASCADRVANRAARLSIEVEGTELRALAREAELGQVLRGLVDNAVDAVQGQADRWIRLRVGIEDKHVVFRCADSRARVEEPCVSRPSPFFDAKPVAFGRGLGLNTSFALVRRMGGFLDYDRAAKYTTFVLGVPVVPEVAPS
jgi:signal transduction histidine kinase